MFFVFTIFGAAIATWYLHVELPKANDGGVKALTMFGAIGFLLFFILGGPMDAETVFVIGTMFGCSLGTWVLHERPPKRNSKIVQTIAILVAIASLLVGFGGCPLFGIGCTYL